MFKRLKKIYHYLASFLAYYRYGRPSRKLIVVGVTGTKGKTTACRFVASVLEAGGYRVGLASTVEFQIGEKRWMNDKKMTMLGRGQLHRLLRDMVAADCQYAVVETSSEGILQYRHIGLNYDIAVFTNLGTEHQERHGGFANLRRDKGRLFGALAKKNKIINGVVIPTVGIVNSDDDNAKFFQNFSSDQKIAYGLLPNRGADILGLAVVVQEKNTTFTVLESGFSIKTPGVFNVYNALAAIAVGRSQGLTDAQIKAGLGSIPGIPGRMEFIEESQPFRVIVDYAHEVLSLTGLFNTLRALAKPNNGRIIAVIGSDGGGRDIQKRGAMGRVAGNLADVVVVSDVNCFDEDPTAIAQMLAAGAREAGKVDGKNLFVVVDRRQGIEKAISLAAKNDYVVITAKGTEPVLCVAGGKRIPWDDRSVAREVLRNLKKS